MLVLSYFTGYTVIHPVLTLDGFSVQCRSGYTTLS